MKMEMYSSLYCLSTYDMAEFFNKIYGSQKSVLVVFSLLTFYRVNRF